MQDSPEILAKELLELARGQLLVNFHFLNRALFSFELVEDKAVTLLCDGKSIHYDGEYLVSIYLEDEQVIARNYLHLLLHLLLGHYLVGDLDEKRWNLASDIAVEALINEFDLDFLNSRRSFRQKRIVQDLRGDKKLFNSEYIYSLLEKFDDDLIDEWVPLFYGDDHLAWYRDGGFDGREQAIIIKQLSRRLELELSLKNGDGSLVRQLRDINKTKRDYRFFLRKFAKRSEVLKISEEEFDQNYYLYGYNHYDRMPIIEPLEYSDDRLIRELVIVLDSSGSIDEELSKLFLEETYRLLSNEELFGPNFNLVIMQCDDEVRELVWVKNRREFESYLANFVVRGLGETDFRPAFALVDKLVQSGQLRDLRGLLYFSDGEGIFPKYARKYQSAFILRRRLGQELAVVPNWLLSFELTDREIRSGKLSV